MPIIGIMASANWASANASSFESIATVTAAGGETSLTFSSIPSTYKHLQVRGIGKAIDNVGGSIVLGRINSDTNSNYATHYLRGDGSNTGASGTATTTSYNLAYNKYADGESNANIYGPIMIDIHDYANTSKYKTMRVFSGTDSNGLSSYVQLGSGLWMSTSAVTSVSLIMSAGTTWKSGSTFALYGIKG